MPKHSVTIFSYPIQISLPHELDAFLILTGGCAAVMGKQVTTGFFQGLKEAGANLLPSIWGDDSSTDKSSHSKHSDHGHKIGHVQESTHSQESDHGLADMGLDSDTSVRVASSSARIHVCVVLGRQPTHIQQAQSVWMPFSSWVLCGL